MLHARPFAAVILAAIALPVSAAEVSKLTSFSDWALYTDADTPHAFCFVTSAPKKSDPVDTAREAPRVYISAWPKDGVKSELSVRLGFPAKKNTSITADIGGQPFRLFADDERAYVKDATTELKLVEAMRKGANMAITATTATGTTVTDTYSLMGLGQAMSELQSTCY